MSDNTGIKWAPNLQQPRHDPGYEVDRNGLSVRQFGNSAAEAQQPQIDSEDGRDLETQGNTPTALFARDPLEKVDEDLCGGLNVPSQPGSSLSLGFVPPRPGRLSPSSVQWSSESLRALSVHEGDRGTGTGPGSSVGQHKLSTRPSQGQMRGRRPSHSKSLSTSHSKLSTNVDHPRYPDQSFAALQANFTGHRPNPPLRTRSSHPAQNLVYNEMSTWKPSRERQQGSHGTRTADNTPMSSPGLFNPDGRVPSASSLTDLSPQLHHLQTPKETHTAEIEHDTFSGNKFINNYEIVQELGRGEHGKVKLGRDIEKGTLVAVKIVPRYSVKRRLGRLGAPEDRTKREVAILKKARHPNVVSLLEVIDDPNKNKVYLILEYVEKGEIKWRKPGVREVLAVNNNRFSQERVGIDVPLEPAERDLFLVAQAARRHEQQERARIANLQPNPNWSLEHGGEDDEEDGFSDISRSGSRNFYAASSNPSRTSSHDDYADSALAGSMYGAYVPEPYRGRKFSVATSAISHMSSEFNFDEVDDEHSFVPALTLEEACRGFRDTLAGLEFLHYIGIIHRDIKPANLLVSANGTVKISDFGVSYLGRPTTEEDPENRLTENDVSALDDEKELARSVGTPAFWAPELCYEDPSMFEEKDGPRITGALDLWALGITLYCMVYARLPFYANDEMGLHEAVCKAEVFCPKSRLVPVDASRDRPTSYVPSSINSNKRLDYELRFEPVPDAVRDLIRKLLIKDPVKRMTIEEAKQHAWVVEGMPDPDQWIQGPMEMAKESKKKILELDEREISHAVGKRNIIERALNTAGRIAGSLLGRSNTRRRAPSTATSASHSSESVVSPSSTSTLGRSDRDKNRDARRSSLRGDEVLAALKTSRENSEHPLAQSQTASPDDSSRDAYFNSLEAPDAISTMSTPMPQYESRPRAPDRAISAMSTAESVKTIRASQMQRTPLPHAETAPELERPLGPGERSFKAMVDGLWEGTSKTLGRLGSRDRRSPRGDRSPAPSRHSSEGDGHAGPSLAVSTASAAGAIEQPEALRTGKSPIDYSSTPSAPPLTNVQYSSSKVQPIGSSQDAFLQAQEVNQRRLIQEAQSQAEAAAAEAASKAHSQPVPDECPPSPDDLMFLEKHRNRLANEPPPFSIEAGPSASTIASSVDGYGTSSVSQNMSNPSFGFTSSASSPPGEGYFCGESATTPRDTLISGRDTEPEFMRTADTIIKHGRPQQQTATGASLEEWADRSCHDADVDDDDSEEEVMMMPSKPTTTTKKPPIVPE